MDLETLLPLLMFVALFAGILTGYPVAFVLAITGVLFGLIGYGCDIFMLSDFGFISSKIFGVISNFTLVAVPLFIFMGITLERSGIAEDLIAAIDHLMRRFRGGLTLTLILVGALLAASTGIVGATVVTMGIISLPAMVERGFCKKLSCGTIAASGTLGQIIPPSIVLILLADMMNIAVADLFAAAVFPGLLLVSAYAGYVFIHSRLWPELSPLPEAQDTLAASELTLLLLKSLAPPFLLIFLVLGSILFGIASPTEAAACGAVAALILTALKKKFTRKLLIDVAERTTSITSMVFTLLIGAQVFSVTFRGLYGDEIIIDMVTSFSTHSGLILFLVMVLLFVLGFFLDFFEICFILIPILSPLLIQELGMNPIWIAILIAINLQTSFLTPPFGFALFYLKGVAPPEITTVDIYKGIIPFVLIQLLVLTLIWIFPQLTLYLPTHLK